MDDACSRTEPLQSAWLDGALEPPAAAQLRAHLGECPRCRRDLQTLGTARTLLRSLPVRQLPDPLRPWVPAPPARPSPRPPAGTRTWRAGRVRATLAVVFGLLGGAAFALGTDAAEPAPIVPVPVEVFVADHVVRTAGVPLQEATLSERRP